MRSIVFIYALKVDAHYFIRPACWVNCRYKLSVMQMNSYLVVCCDILEWN